MERMRYFSLLGVVLAVSGVEIAARGWWAWQLLGLALATPPLVWSDLRERRLPNRLLGALAAFEALSLGGQWLLTGDSAPFARAISAATLVGGIAVAASLASRGALGMGDAKLIGVLGLALAARSLGVYAAALLLAFALNAGVALYALRTRGKGSRIPFGPSLLAAAWLAAVLALPIERWLYSLTALA